MREYHDLGQFWVPSGQVLISDPDYLPGTGHTRLVKKCKAGKWYAAFVEMLPYVNPGMLVIRHESLPDWNVFDKITTTITKTSSALAEKHYPMDSQTSHGIRAFPCFNLSAVTRQCKTHMRAYCLLALYLGLGMAMGTTRLISTLRLYKVGKEA